MDIFFEQLITIKKTPLQIIGIIGIWAAAALISVVLFLTGILSSLTLIVVLGIIYGAYKLCCLLNIEYEYIITNGTLDIDKITNKSSRKRVLSLELAKVSRLEKYSEGIVANINAKNIVYACNKTDEGAFFLVADKTNGCNYLVFSPNDRLKEAIIKFVPKFISNSAFK